MTALAADRSFRPNYREGVEVEFMVKTSSSRFMPASGDGRCRRPPDPGSRHRKLHICWRGPGNVANVRRRWCQETAGCAGKGVFDFAATDT